MPDTPVACPWCGEPVEAADDRRVGPPGSDVFLCRACRRTFLGKPRDDNSDVTVWQQVGYEAAKPGEEAAPPLRAQVTCTCEPAAACPMREFCRAACEAMKERPKRAPRQTTGFTEAEMIEMQLRYTSGPSAPSLVGPVYGYGRGSAAERVAEMQRLREEAEQQRAALMEYADFWPSVKKGETYEEYRKRITVRGISPTRKSGGGGGPATLEQLRDWSAGISHPYFVPDETPPKPSASNSNGEAGGAEVGISAPSVAPLTKMQRLLRKMTAIKFDWLEKDDDTLELEKGH